MKKVIFCIACLLMLSLVVFSQSNYKLVMGEEIKLKKGTADLDIVMADKSGLYFTEERLKVQSYILFASAKAAIKLYKIDNNFSEVFDKEYKKELKGLEFHSFQALGEDLYMFATDYTKKERLFTVYGAKIDKNNGDLLGDFIELGHYELESKKDDYEMKMTLTRDSTAFLMVSNISNKDRVSIAVSVLDKNFKKKEATVIPMSFDPGLYTLQDVKLTANNKIVLLGREYELTQVGKKKRKRLVFKNYAMDVYDVDGKRIHGIPMQTGDRFIINGKLVDQPGGGLLLAGFYSNTSKKDDLNGFFINKVDVDNGTLAVSSYKEINASMFGKAYADEGDEDDETRDEKKQAKKAKDDDDEDELPNEYIIRSVDINPTDNSIVITSEVSQHSYYTYSVPQYNSATRMTTYTTTTVHRFTNQDILVINADKNGNIRWINDIAKSQVEEVRNSNSGYGVTFGSFENYFANAGGMPYYSSYKSLIYNNNLVLLMNDHTSNNVNPQYGDKVRSVYNFRKKSNTYGIAIDLATGKMTRKFIASNNDETILMPRHAYIVKNDLYMPSWRMRAMAKTKLQFAKLTVK
jgi:hypothetical protein